MFGWTSVAQMTTTSQAGSGPSHPEISVSGCNMAQYGRQGAEEAFVNSSDESDTTQVGLGTMRKWLNEARPVQ